MRLLSTTVYRDPQGVEWIAGDGDLINGASIPRILWRSVGCPFVGQYRVASVYHDVACHYRDRPHGQVHRMFFDCMVECGVGVARARLMADAVEAFGPRWTEDGLVTQEDASPVGNVEFDDAEFIA